MIDPVVDLDWVRAQGDRVVLADVRYYLDGRSGRAAYEQGHLPGAIFVDVDRDLAAHGAPAAEGRHPLPDPEVFAERHGRGWASATSDTVVGYDDAGGVMAARLVWMLRVTGHDAALLDGGLTAYAGRSGIRPRRPPAGAVHRPALAGGPAGRHRRRRRRRRGSVVLDARQRERFRGDTEPIDPRPGHIPGARSLPCRENVDADGRFLPVAELRERFAAVGVSRGHAGRLLLRLRRDRLPQPDRPRARRAGRRAGSTRAPGRSTRHRPPGRHRRLSKRGRRTRVRSVAAGRPGRGPRPTCAGSRPFVPGLLVLPGLVLDPAVVRLPGRLLAAAQRRADLGP